MEICLVGSLLPTEVFDDIVKKSKAKPSNAPENFQMMLVKGLASHCDKVTVISFPTMAPYPKGSSFCLSERKYKLFENVEIISAPMLNIQGAKQRTIHFYAYQYVKNWLKKSTDSPKIVISYSDYPPYADACRKACAGDIHAKCVLLMTDLPTYSIYKHTKNVYSYMMRRMDRKRIENYDMFDAYILLTKYMQEEMRVQTKPTIVVEGFSDPDAHDFSETKVQKKTLMYAGALSRVHNVHTLISAFQKTSMDVDFWVYGDGELRNVVVAASKEDCRIHYFGKVSREEMLRAQKRAHLLISAKSTDDAHTKFAFPSKILEYMSSGTAVLSTRVGGIPSEYFQYLLPIEDESINGIAASIENAFSKTKEELEELGNKARDFAVQKKNCYRQSERIVDFLCQF